MLFTHWNTIHLYLQSVFEKLTNNTEISQQWKHCWGYSHTYKCKCRRMTIACRSDMWAVQDVTKKSVSWFEAVWGVKQTHVFVIGQSSWEVNISRMCDRALNLFLAVNCSYYLLKSMGWKIGSFNRQVVIQLGLTRVKICSVASNCVITCSVCQKTKL